MLKVPTPELSGAEAGRVAAESLEVMVMELGKLVTVLLYASFAARVTLIGVPALVVVGADVKTSEVAAPGVMATIALLETATDERVTPRVMDPTRIPVKLAL